MGNTIELFLKTDDGEDQKLECSANDITDIYARDFSHIEVELRGEEDLPLRKAERIKFPNGTQVEGVGRRYILSNAKTSFGPVLPNVTITSERDLVILSRLIKKYLWVPDYRLSLDEVLTLDYDFIPGNWNTNNESETSAPVQSNDGIVW